MNKVVERQAVVFSDTTDADLITFVSDELESAVQIFHVRGGRIHGQRGWVVERGDNSDASLLGEFITQFYGEEAELARATETAVGGSSASEVDLELAKAINPAAVTELGDLVGDVQVTPVPKEVLVHTMPEGIDELSAWLSELRGSQVTIRVPQRGDKKQLLETANQNAKQASRSISSSVPVI